MEEELFDCELDQIFERIFELQEERALDEDFRRELIEYITNELSEELLTSYSIEFLFDLAKFIQGYGYM